MLMNRRTTSRLLAGLGALLACLPAPVSAVEAGTEKVVLGTNWRAQAEHGGFYQALATGLYAERGLDVEIREGGPQVNHRQLIAAGRLDFYMGGNLFGQFDFLREGIPVVTVAAMTVLRLGMGEVAAISSPPRTTCSPRSERPRRGWRPRSRPWPAPCLGWRRRSCRLRGRGRTWRHR